MLKLILRQLGKHRGPLLSVLLVWIGLGTPLYYYRHEWFSAVARWFVDTPPPGRQDQAAARPYVERARDRIQDEHINLVLMSRSCYEFLPYRYHGDVSDFRPHWLEKIDRWNLSDQPRAQRANIDRELVEPDAYWQEHQETVLAAFRDLLGAMNLAYELEPINDTGPGEIVYIPELVAAHARALCREELGQLAWGDYIVFQEERAWQHILSGQPDLIDQDVPGNQKRELILEELEGDQKYINALIEYTGGDPPYRGELRTCKDGRFRLSCVAPLEAIEIYRKWLAVEVIRANLSRVHINLGNAYLMQAEMSDDPGPYLEEALQHFEHAALAGEALDARLARSYIFLRMRRYDDSYIELKEIRSRIPRANSREAEFRELARKTLIGQGRFQDADCFADIRNMSHGPRSHCQQMQF